MVIEASPETKVVIDTTTLLQSIPTRGRYHHIIEAFVEGSFHLVVSHQILLEYEEILKDHGGPSAWQAFQELLDELRPHVKHVIPSYFWDAIERDRDDNKFVDAAVAGGAELIVTNDRHFNVLHTQTEINVTPIDPQKFIADFC